jgi:UPF0271 protein
MHNQTIDLNADLGESVQRLADGSDADVMRHITSANIACGGHAGDANTMEQTLELAKQHNIAIGAHPSYPDRAGFGRTSLDISIAELERSVSEQINELIGIARRLDVNITYVKPHGALYHDCNRNAEIARALGRAALIVNPQLILVGQAGAHCLEIYRQMGLRTAAEAFADRTYEADGILRERKLSGALIESPEDAAAQAIAIAINKRVFTSAGSELSISAETLCIHSDTQNAAAIAGAIRERLALAGIAVRRFADMAIIGQ